LSDATAVNLNAVFGITQETASKYMREHEDRSRIILPIYRYNGTVRGIVSRAYWWDKQPQFPKAKTYLHADSGEGISWYRSAHANVYEPVVLVEDQLSAIKGMEWSGKTFVSLLGTTLNIARVAEIQKHAHTVWIALDADATDTAFDHARKFGQAFLTCRVVVLSKDVKDMSYKEIKETFDDKTDCLF
jgi:DNA primase